MKYPDQETTHNRMLFRIPLKMLSTALNFLKTSKQTILLFFLSVLFVNLNNFNQEQSSKISTVYLYFKNFQLSFSFLFLVFFYIVCVVVQIFQTSLIFTFLCLKSITIIRDKEKQKLNWFEKF